MKHPLILALHEQFSGAADKETAAGQAAYMRDQFAFLGLKKPLREEIQKKVFKSHFISQKEELALVIENLWQKDHREFHYSALDLITKYSRLWSPAILALFEKMIRQRSWWDTVDLIAAKHVGGLLKKYPELIPTMDRWLDDPDLWIRRSAILFQLKWKEETDEKRLFGTCIKLAHEKDFFIRKAIGWSLREYSKTAPASVQRFIEANQKSLSPLSIREGSKYLQK